MKKNTLKNIYIEEKSQKESYNIQWKEQALVKQNNEEKKITLTNKIYRGEIVKRLSPRISTCQSVNTYSEPNEPNQNNEKSKN